MSLFKETTKIGQSKIEMSPDDVIEFLKEVENKGLREDSYPFVEKYLEMLVEVKDIPDRFFTYLASIYIE